MMGLILTLFMIVFAMFGWLKLDINAMRAEFRAAMAAFRRPLWRFLYATKTPEKPCAFQLPKPVSGQTCPCKLFMGDG